MREGVRPAGPAETAVTDALFRAARREVRGRRGGADLLALEPPGSAQRQVLLGTLDGVPLGVAAGWLTGPDVGWLACCYVEPPARGVGLGTALVEGMLGWFSESGCQAVDAPALPGDRESKQLFEQSGFKARLLVLRRPLH